MPAQFPSLRSSASAPRIPSSASDLPTVPPASTAAQVIPAPRPKLRPSVSVRTTPGAVERPTSFSFNSGLGEAGIPLPWWKRALDLWICALALPLLALCALGMLILTRRYSPGPVLFRQERVGYMGRRFTLYKFRTMHSGADATVHQAHVHELIRSNAPMEKLDARGDARIIPFTRLLRATGLDELPQLLNVWRGEMSLVGPRPCLPSEFAQYVSWQRQRCDAVPGLTGLWQVSGKNRTTFEQMLRLDVQYARSISPALDLRILVRTLPAILHQVRDTRRAHRTSDHTAAAIGLRSLRLRPVRSSAR